MSIAFAMNCPKIILTLKTSVLPIHQAQILTYMKLGEIKVGFIIDFNVKKLTQGIKSFAL